MANVLELLFKGRCKPDHVVSWIQMETTQQQVDIPEVLLSLQSERREFIPYLLNYLRGQTFHLLQKSKSISPSPVKWKRVTPATPQSTSTVRSITCKRVQLFPDDKPKGRSFTSFAEEFPQLQAEPISAKSSQNFSPKETIPNNSSPFTTPKNDENNFNRRFKRSTKICLSDFLSNDSKNTWSNSNNSTNNVQPLSSSTKLVNKKRGRKPSPPEVKSNKEKSLNFLDNRHNVIPSSTEHQKTPTEIKPSRRIKPTPVQAGMERKQNEAFIQMPESKPESNIFNKNQENLKRSDISAKFKEKELLSLRMEGSQILESSPNKWNVSPTKQYSFCNKQSTDVKDSIEVSLASVTHQEELNILIELYSGCFHASLFPNLTVEIFFLIQLLVVRCTKEDIDEETDFIGYDFLRSIHNVVYFSLKVLEKLVWLLPSLGPAVLRLLSDNTRVESLSASLKKHLCKVQENTDRSPQLSPLLPRSSIGGVSFQAETDNRNNFPTPKSFSMFRVQRDSFYELIREWKDNHEKPQWTFRGALERKIHYTFSSDMELANYWHLAKLFISQLITMYKEDNSVALHDDDDSISFISQLKKTNPEKYKRLQERFIIPLSTNGPSPPPSFTGSQEFFHDYIISANNHVFNQHISDILKAKIFELDRYQFVSLQSVNEENGDTSSDIAKEFKSCLLTLRLLAKFLGFLTFLPYQSVSSLPEEVHPAFLEIKNNSTPACDILFYLNLASTKGRLCYTIPWIVEFLGWMDFMSPMLDYYQNVFQKMLSIHRQAWTNLRSGFCVRTQLFIIVQIEWLFGIPNIPDGTFFNLMHTKSEAHEVPNECIDNMDLIDQSMLYICCPYLGSIKSLLLEFASGSSTKASTLRKITPVAADDSPRFSTTRQLQLQLEDNFFHNHPASLKRTAEFVAERTASNFIKQFRNVTLVKLLQNGCDKMSLFTAKNSTEPNLKDLKLEAIETYAKEFMSDVQKFLSNELKSYVQVHARKVIDVFLPGQTDTVKTTIVSIIVRLAEERVQQWMMAKITKGIFTREMMKELSKSSKPSKVIPEISLPSHHDENSPCPSEILIDFKIILRQILLKETLPNVDKLKISIDKANKMLSCRQDKSVNSRKHFKDFISHLAIQMIINHPKVWTSIEENYLSLWNEHLRDEKHDITVSKEKLDRMLSKSPEKELSKMQLESLSLTID